MKSFMDFKKIPKINNFIQKLINEDKVVFNIFLADLSKVVLEDLNHLQEELKDHAGVDILLGDGCQPQVGPLDVEERCPGYVGHWRPHLKDTKHRFCNCTENNLSNFNPTLPNT
jgi:hypothetical protein